MENNGLQIEFEEYIEKLARQVRTEIYPEELKKIYISYQECLKGMQAQTDKLAESAKWMKEQRVAANVDLNSIRDEVEESTKKVEKAIEFFYQGYEKILSEYEEKIIFLNEKERENYNKQFQKILKETNQKEKEELEICFHTWKEELENLSENIPDEEYLSEITKQLEQVNETIRVTNDMNYLEKVMEFEEQIRIIGLSERKEMEYKIKDIFHREKENIKQMLEAYKNSLEEISHNSMTKQEVMDFREKLSEYTREIQRITDRRYEEVLKAFEEKLFQMGSLQFANYIRVLSESSLKVSDLEIFLKQIKLLEESMKQKIENSKEEYRTIFAGYRADVQAVNEETKQRLMKELTDLFQEQFHRMKESMETHREEMEKFRKEQEDMVQCVNMIRDLSEKNHSHLILLSRVMTDLSSQQTFMSEKLTMATDALEDTLKLVREGNQQFQQNFHQLQEQKDGIGYLTKQNEENICQVQEIAEKMDGRTLDLSKQMKEISENNKEQLHLMKALIAESPGWKVDLFGRFEINLIYVIIIMLAWICFRVM